MVPLDIIGGLVLPRLFGRQNIAVGYFVRRWAVGVSCQATFFFASGIRILTAGRIGDCFAATLPVLTMASMLVMFQHRIALLIIGSKAIGEDGTETAEPLNVIRSSTPIIFADHKDPGFTGGVGRPELWVMLPTD